jgi:hypothetical protein
MKGVMRSRSRRIHLVTFVICGGRGAVSAVGCKWSVSHAGNTLRNICIQLCQIEEAGFDEERWCRKDKGLCTSARRALRPLNQAGAGVPHSRLHERIQPRSEGCVAGSW